MENNLTFFNSFFFFFLTSSGKAKIKKEPLKRSRDSSLFCLIITGSCHLLRRPSPLRTLTLLLLSLYAPSHKTKKFPTLHIKDNI